MTREATAVRPLVAYATFYRDGAKIFETEAVGADAWEPKTKAVPIRIGISPGQLQPGQYDCQVTVLDPSGDRTAYWRAAVTVIR